MTSIFSFFSGTGFLDLGFEKEGYSIASANEIKDEFSECYGFSRKAMNIPLPKYGLLRGDVSSYLSEKPVSDNIREQMLEERKNGLVGFIGGPPCPDFSVAGKNMGAEGKNGMLSQTYMDVICEFKPDFFLFENVKGLVRTAKHLEFFKHMLRQASENGYATTRRLANALEYGAPQDRDRVLVFGVRRDLHGIQDMDIRMAGFRWNAPDWKPSKEIKALPWPDTDEFSENSERPAPEGIPLNLTAEYWFRRNDVENHPNAEDFFTPRAGLSKMTSIAEGDVSRKSYKRLHRWRYSPTVAYGNNEVHLHPYKARRLSVAEALALQSLPKEYSLPKGMSLSAKFKTVGNGVPFLLAEGVAKAIGRFLTSLEKEPW